MKRVAGGVPSMVVQVAEEIFRVDTDSERQ